MGNETAPVPVVFGERLREERLRRRWRLSDLASRCAGRGLELHLTAYAKMEKGEREPRLSEAVTIADVLGMPLSALLIAGAGDVAARAGELARQALEAAGESTRQMVLAAQLLTESQALARGPFDAGSR